MPEWEFDSEIGRGASGRRATLVQEWLSLHDVQVAIDGKYGPATAQAVRQFQGLRGLRPTGTVNRTTFDALLQPMTEARAEIAAQGRSLGDLMIAYAKRHLAQRPREIGGQNLGPWVRLYMRGNEGPDYPWCAGFACFVLQQACGCLARSAPLRPSFSCDLLATDAQKRTLFLAETKRRSPDDTPAGSFFLSRRVVGDWVHTGLVLSAGKDTFETIEGNTNDAGDREGYEVCRRVRGYKGKDFIVLN
jgi:Putative peptidoglycan binding domain